MKIEHVHWTSSQLITEHYIHTFSKVEKFYEYNPSDFRSYERRLQWLDADSSLRADRSKLADILFAYNTKIGNAPEAIRAIHDFKDHNAVVVVGGQQAGLFGGPLLVIYKAITIIQEAREASERLGRNVIPIFWIAGEDHDFDEVNHIHTLTSQLEVRKIQLQSPAEKRNAVSRIEIPQTQWVSLLQQIEESLIDTEFKQGIVEKLQNICTESLSLVDHFSRVIAYLFGSYGLVLVNSDDSELRSLEGAMFRQIVENNKAINDALLTAKEHVEAAGYTPQVDIFAGQANVFTYIHDERILLVRQGDGFTDKRNNYSFTRTQLLDLAQHAPERLSNNVLSRPLMQEFLFPVLSTVLGPSEIAYWGLLRQAFSTMGMQMPILIPRLEFTLLEGTTQKQMRKYELEFADVLYRLELKKKEWLSEQDQLRLDEQFTEVKQRFSEMYVPLLEQIAKLNPGLQKLGDTNMQKIIEQIDFLLARSTDAYQSQFEAGLRQFERIQLSTLPLGKPQERVYNVFAYMNKYGDGWLRELTNTRLPRDGFHRIVYF